MKYQGTQNTRTIFKERTKLEDSHFLILKLTKKLQSSKQCGIGINRQIHQQMEASP